MSSVHYATIDGRTRRRELKSLFSVRALVAKACPAASVASLKAKVTLTAAALLSLLLLLLVGHNAAMHRVRLSISFTDSGAAGAVPVLPRTRTSIMVGIHIPHTGGRVVKRELERWGQTSGMEVAAHGLDFLALTPDEQDRYGAIWSFRGFGIHRQPGWLTVREPRYFTLLRDPLVRVLAQFEAERHVSGGGGDNAPSFSQWFEDGGTGGHLDPSSPLYLPNNPVSRQLCCWWPNPKHHTAPPAESCHAEAADQRATFECAKSNLLRYFVVVGIQERIEETMRLLRHQLGAAGSENASAWRLPPAPTMHALTPQEEALVRRLNQYDFALYAFASTLFEKQLRGYD